MRHGHDAWLPGAQPVRRSPPDTTCADGADPSHVPSDSTRGATTTNGGIRAMETIYRAEVIGSTLRPQYLKRARAAFEAGEMDAAEFKRIEDRAVDQAIAMQEGAGLDVVTDGEMRRYLFIGPLSETVEGLEPVSGNVMPWHTAERLVEWEMPVAVTGKLRQRRSLAIEEFSYARSRARQPLKVTLPSPLVIFGMWTPAHSQSAYPDPFEMFSDAADILRADVQTLAALGCTYIQIDAPELTTLVDPTIRAWAEQRDISAARMLAEGIDLIDSVAKDVAGVHFAIHLCRGNNQGMWMAQGGYDYIADALFQRTPSFDTYLLEYDDPRSGSFEPLSGAPKEKAVVLGLVSSKSPELETTQTLTERIHEAERYFPHDQLALSTQCGFASSADGNPVGEDAQERKLRLVAEVAHTVWS